MNLLFMFREMIEEGKFNVEVNERSSQIERTEEPERGFSILDILTPTC